MNIALASYGDFGLFRLDLGLVKVALGLETDGVFLDRFS